MSGFTLIDCPARGKKETLDKRMIVDILAFAWERAARRIPTCVVLITSDGDYAYTGGVSSTFILFFMLYHFHYFIFEDKTALSSQ